MRKSPSIILTSQYKIPGANFTTYIDYCTREKALLEKEAKELNEKELTELNRIQRAMGSLDVRVGGAYSKLKEKVLSEKEWEAQALLTSPELFDTSSNFEKYIGYAARKYALASKKKMTEGEKEEAALLEKHIQDITPNLKEHYKNSDQNEILPGVFSKDKDIITKKDNEDIKELVNKAEKNGSICYQDVISFDTDFLIEQKIYNPETYTLDENKIRNATHKMMEQLFKDEKIEENNGFWTAMIHRNTNHIHIHFTTVEKENRRKMVVKEVDGVKYYEPKGKRKQDTLDNMKSVFANSLVDHTNELSRMSMLRDKLREEIKEELKRSKEIKKDKEVILLQEIHDSLPSNKKEWVYKRLSPETKEKVDTLTDLLLKDNPNFSEYKEAIKIEQGFRKGLYGESKRENKDYEKNQTEAIYKRMGNSLLEELRKKKPVEENLAYNYQEKQEQIKMKYEGKNDSIQNGYSKYKAPVIRKKDVRKIAMALNDDFEKWRAEREFERVQERIEREREQGIDY